MALMRKAMDYITKLNPCVTFVPATSPNFVTIHSGPTCSSEVGMRGGEQLLFMHSDCFWKGLIVPVQLLVRTLGFMYEHNRTLVLAGTCIVHKAFWTNSKGVAMISQVQAIPLDTTFRLGS